MKLYTLSALGPPQNSEALPAQGMLHEEAVVGTPDAAMTEVPQKHCLDE